ncbi:MAG: hypothetical protein WCT01_01200 [Candidatus Shapirobacteria bacterium]
MNFKWLWSVLIIMGLLLVIFIDGQSQVKAIESCKNLRIIPLTEKYFTFKGIYDLVEKGSYQPKCL